MRSEHGKKSMSSTKGQGESKSRRAWLIAAALALLTYVAFAPALDCDFVNLDDPDYVLNNTHVKAGLNADGISWAFKSFAYGNWHPLTWLSLESDSSLWQKPDESGPDPRGFHLTNVLVHAASAALLFLTLRALTGVVWPSAAAAALFAVHPLRVESVAWVAERKDVLSTFFGILTLLAYAYYVRKPSASRYLAVVAAFVLSLMSKPMMITLPCLFLVLDWWPLNRAHGKRDIAWLAIEKVPLITLVAVSSVVTFVAQSRGGAVMDLETFPLLDRFENAPISYVEYLRKTFWPTGLAVFYPHRSYPWGAGLALPTVVGATAIVIVFTIATFLLRKRAPYLLAGWLWYLGTLVPVIGIVQVGDQSHADRYTYFPQIGLLIAVCWGVADLARRWPVPALVSAVAAVAALCVLTHRQLEVWESSEKLWRHDLATTDASPLALTDLGVDLSAQGRYDEADDYLCKSLALSSKSVFTHINRGNLLLALNRLPEAESEFATACDLQPNYPHPLTQLAEVLLRENKLKDAAKKNQEALQLAPEFAAALCNQGLIEIADDKPDEAMRQFREAIRLQPDLAAAHSGLGMLLLQKRKIDEGFEHLHKAVRYKPRSGEANLFLALALERSGHADAAARYFDRATEFSPGVAAGWAGRGRSYYRLRDIAAALACFRKAAELEPGTAEYRIRVKQLEDGQGLKPLDPVRQGS
jgi:tetratricopeptide (TPR) repeat protein